MFHCYVLFHPVSLQVLNKSFGLFHPVSEIFLYILFVSFVTKQKWVYKKKKDVCFIVSFHFTLFRNEHISNCLVCYIQFQIFLYVLYISFVTKQKWAYKKKCLAKQSICFIVTLRYTLFRNKH